MKNDLTLFDSLNYNHGWLEAGVGSYFLPTAKLVYSSPLSGGMIEARAGGKPLKAIGVQFQKSPLCLTSKKDKGIKSPKDLLGKKVGVSMPKTVLMTKADPHRYSHRPGSAVSWSCGIFYRI